MTLTDDTSPGVHDTVIAACDPFRAGDTVTRRAEVDVIVIASACPMDIVPINGPGGETTPRSASSQAR